MRWICSAMVRTWASDSMTHGPAIRKSWPSPTWTGPISNEWLTQSIVKRTGPWLWGCKGNRAARKIPDEIGSWASVGKARSGTIFSGMSNKLAFLFPGQGSQAVGMGRELAERFSVARDTFAEADEAAGFPLSKLIFEGPEEELKLTENTQPAILTVSVATLRVLALHGIEPDLAAGHSLGEWSAHVAAGTYSFADAVRFVKARGKAMQLAFPAGQGGMAAILSLTPEQVAEACTEAEAETGLTVSPANFNSPGQTVISGALAAASRAARQLSLRSL